MWAREADQNKADMAAIVESDEVPGLLAYVQGEPVGWVSVSPMNTLQRVARGADDCWLIACLFVAESARGLGVGPELVRQAIRFASENGATTIEALPRGWRPDESANSEAVDQMLRNAGFAAVNAQAEGVEFRLYPPEVRSAPTL
jgi:GNAT superfamily N-acetyltransferase